MLKTIIEKEIRDLIGSTKFVATFGVTALLILLAFYAGAKNHNLAVAQYDASRAENLRQMEGLTDWMSLQQHRIFLPPQPLASLVNGISNDIGQTTEVRTRGELAAEDSRFNEDPIYAVFRFLDLSFIFQVVLSLFAILLGYDAISGEKERGTLRLVFSNAAPRAMFILGKILGSFIVMAASLIVALSLGSLLLPALGVNLNSEEWMRLGLIVLTGLLYLGAFLSISVFVSTMTQRTSSSFLALLVIWIGGVLILPRAATLLAGRAVDVPSVDELAAQKASYSRQLWQTFRADMKNFRAPEGAPKDDVQATLSAFNQYMDSVTAIRDEKMDAFAGRLNEERHNRQMQRQKVAFNFARVSPAASLSLATARLAGTSLDLKNRFYEEATAYRKAYNAFMKEKTGMNVGGRMMMWKMTDGEEEPPEKIDLTELPAFDFNTASLSDALGDSIVDIGLLGLFNLLFIAGAFVAFMRYDLR